MFTPDQINTIIAAIIAIVSAITAYLKNNEVKTTVAAMTSGTPESQTPAVIAALPGKTWKMTDSVKHNLTMDATPANAARILAQVDAAETQFKTHYRINYVGGYYIIDYGLLESDMGNPSHDTGSDGSAFTEQSFTHPRTGRMWATKELAIINDGAI